MSLRARAALAASLLLAALAGCREAPTATETEPGAALRGDGPRGAESARLERLARRFALALRDDALRAEVHAALDASPYREHKLPLRRFLQQDDERRLRAVARRARVAEADVRGDLEGGELEFYLPVVEHRALWSGDDAVLVATADGDTVSPVAFDLAGRRHRLDPATPPQTPVIAVVAAELDFDAADRRMRHAVCTTCEEPLPPTNSYVQPGLYATRIDFRDDFEGWLKGDPEYEIHVLGPAATGDTTNLRTFQCIGAQQGSPYRWDQNENNWTGSQLLYSGTQLEAFNAAHPGQALTIMAYEDDDTACQIKTSEDRLRKLFDVANTTYRKVKSGRGTKRNAVWYWEAMRSGFALLTSAYSVITTGDDVIGIAIADSVAGTYRAGTNWTFRGDDNRANGWIQLETK